MSFLDGLTDFAASAGGRVAGFQSFLDIPVTAASRAAAAVRAVGGNEGGLVNADIAGPVAGPKVQAAAAEGFSSSQGQASGLGITGSLESGRKASSDQAKILGLDRNVALGLGVVIAILVLPKLIRGK